MNFPLPFRARPVAFLGDVGSTALGFAITWFAIDLTQGPGRSMPPVAALWVAALPLADGLSIIIWRIREGRSPSSCTPADSMFIRASAPRSGINFFSTASAMGDRRRFAVQTNGIDRMALSV